MFLFTTTRTAMRQVGTVTLCAVCLAGTVAASVHYASDESLAVGAAVSQSAPPVQSAIETTQDIASFFAGYGYEIDLANTNVDQVKIPKRWDDSFNAFRQVVQESGLELSGCKGKTVEKWMALCPARCTADSDCYCVLLVYKAKPIGAYLLTKPSGEVSGLVSAAQTMAETAEPQTEQEVMAQVVTEGAWPTD